MNIVIQAVVLLGAAVTMVPLFRRFGLGAVLGYLAAGALVGPWLLGLYGDPEQLFHVGELGIVLLFFVIGLELQPRRLWLMRKAILGLGGAQMLLCALPILGFALLLGLPTGTAVLVALALAFSSTPFALQLLSERGQLGAAHGRKSFAVLLFQDLAVVPLLALIPVFGTGQESAAISPWYAAIRAIVLVAVIVVLGRYLLRYALRIVARAGVSELFTAMALLTVAVTALIAEYAGLSMALGGFLAGVLLADSEYRHALEADLNPFKGLLLGLFFMSVGMTANLGLFVEQPLLILGLAVGLMLLKSAVLFGLMRRAGLPSNAAATAGSVLSQGGEFAFVVFSAGIAAGVMDGTWLDLLVAVIIVSMALTPLYTTLVSRHGDEAPPSTERSFDTPDMDEPRVVIAGFGRFGQIVARLLRASHIPFTALELDPERVAMANRFGTKIYYGDSTHLELLRAARVDRAKVFVLALGDVEASLWIVRELREHFPKVTIFARAHDREHAYQLMELGVQHVFRETFHTSLEMARGVLTSLGFDQGEANHVVERFRENDEGRLRAALGKHHDLEKLIALAKQSERELDQLLEQDRADRGDA